MSESDGSLTVMASILNGTIPENDSVRLRFDTQNGTALGSYNENFMTIYMHKNISCPGGEDFMAIRNRSLIFDENVTSQAIAIKIVQDNIPEKNEEFFIVIRDPNVQSNTTVVKRASIMIGVSGKAKISIGMFFK